MSGVGRFSLGIGLALIAVAVVCAVVDVVAVAAIAGILGVIGIGIAGYDAVYEWWGRRELRRRQARVRRDPR